MPSMSTTAPLSAAQAQLEALQRAFPRLVAEHMSVADFSLEARNQSALLAALPERYAPVLLGLLDRLESSALFSEESCSFSQKDLLANLQLWLDKAQQQIHALSAE
jgi:hypothetical protein